MANLTLAIDDELLHQARKFAQERRTTVNQLVREYLTGLVGDQRRKRAARERLMRACRKGVVKIDSRSWTRDDLYKW